MTDQSIISICGFLSIISTLMISFGHFLFNASVNLLHSQYIKESDRNVIRDCYEAFVIASFFALLCHYLAPNLQVTIHVLG
jgi:hypothetical protein